MSYPEQSSPVRVHVSDGVYAFAANGPSFRLSLYYGPNDVKVGKVNERGTINFEPYDTTSLTDPGITFSLPDEFARALLEKLLQYYQGASDMHTVRADLLHERGRVDKMIETISNIAKTFSEG